MGLERVQVEIEGAGQRIDWLNATDPEPERKLERLPVMAPETPFFLRRAQVK